MPPEDDTPASRAASAALGFAAIRADVPAFKAECLAAARRDCPWMTEEQIEASWRYASELFGL